MKYTEEEKKVIKDFKEDTRNAKIYKFQKRCEVNIKILDLLEKQQKEIEKLEEHLNQYYDGKLFTANQLKAIEREQNKSFIHKDKIRRKIKELEQVKYDEGKYNEKKSIDEYIYEFSKSYEYEVAQIIIKILKELLGE